MKTLNTVYPYGLNDQVKGVGLISRADISTFDQSNSPFFTVSLPRSWRSHGFRKSKKHRRNSKLEVSTIVYELFDCLKEHGLNSLYTSLRGLSHTTILKLRHFISSHSDNFNKQFMDCIYAFSSHIIKPNAKNIKKDRLILVLPFLNQITEKLKVSQILSSKVLKNKIPQTLKYHDTPMVSFKYGKTIGQTIFNYNEVLENLTDEDLNNTECDCDTNNMYSEFVYNHHGHVHTGSIDIIKNSKLYQLMKKGAQFRETKFYSMQKHYHIMCEHIDKFVTKWVNKEKCDPSLLKDWLNTFKIFLHRKLKNVFNHHKCTSQVLKDPEVVEYLNKLKSRFVIVPVDKAAKNFAFICKSYYIKVLMQELGVSSSSEITGNLVYKPVHNTLNNIIQNHKSVLEDNFNIKLSEKDLRVPLLYWNSKQHKTPYKARFIAGATHCTTKPLSVELSLVMKCIKKHFMAYCEQIHQRTGISVYWSVDNSLQCIKKLDKLTATSVHTFDFSTLYTNLPLKSIEDALQQLVIKMFKNSGRNYILVNTFYKNAFWSDSPKNGYKVFTLDKVIASLHWILFNTYVRFGEKLFRQEKGIPMGGNCSPLIADLYLSWLEYKFMKDLMPTDFPLAKKLSSNSRYIDDIITPNIPNFLDIASSIYPKELPLEISSSNHLHDCFLDLDIVVKNDKFITKIYHKVDLFNFEVISYPFPDSNIPSHIGYNTFLSQLIRFSRVCTLAEDFAFRTKLIYDKMVHRGYDKAMLRKYFVKFCCATSDRVCYYGYYNFLEFFNFCITFVSESQDTQLNNHADAVKDNIKQTCSGSDQLYLKTSTIPAPLENIGNTCYLNASLQILFMLNKVFNFGHWVSKDIDYSHVSISDLTKYLAFRKFLYLATLRNISRMDLDDFVSIICSIDSFFDLGTQKDAHEAFLKLFGIFDTGTSAVLPNHFSISDTYLQGIYKKIKTCTKCNNTTLSFETFAEIRIFPVGNIDKAIAGTVKDEPVECFCLYCKSNNRHLISRTVHDHPRVLLVLVDRYTQSSSYARHRRNCSILGLKYSLNLHGQNYRLGGIIKHLGASVSSGHYIAYVLKDDNWYSCNDSRVQKIESLPEQCVDSYLLFFIKQ